MISKISFPGDDQDLIGSLTPGEDVISTLARHGCSDLTAGIDLAACGNLPRAGGGFCDVYQGRLNDGGHIAIKSLRLYDRPGKNNEKQKILKRAARELYHWSKLNHPNILPLMGLAMFRGHLSMISEWMDNGSLTEYISLNPDADRISLCIGICTGLSHIHANEMVHGDLKAANVLISRGGVAMIADFGNSQIKDLTLRFTDTTSSSFSVRWAAPELLLGEGDDCRISKESDVYAYGMTVLEAMTGKVPFEELNEQNVLVSVAVQSRTPVRPEFGIGNEMWNVLQRCWSKEKSVRPDIRSVEERLREIYFQAWIKTNRRNSLRTSHFKVNESAMPRANPNGQHSSDGPLRDYKRKLQILATLAKKQAKTGQLADAESLEVEVVAVMKRMLGEDHPETLQSMHLLATIYSNQGRLEEAKSVEVEIVAAKKRVLGVTHPSTLHSMNTLAIIYNKQGRLAEAESLGVEVLAARKRVSGENHPDTLQSKSTLAATYQEQGRLTEAESLEVEVVSASKQVLGEDHPDTLQNMMNLAVIYKKQGRLAGAESLVGEVLGAHERILGKHHPDTLKTMRQLKRIYRAQGRHPELYLLTTQFDNSSVAAG